LYHHMHSKYRPRRGLESRAEAELGACVGDTSEVASSELRRSRARRLCLRILGPIQTLRRRRQKQHMDSTQRSPLGSPVFGFVQRTTPYCFIAPLRSVPVGRFRCVRLSTSALGSRREASIARRHTPPTLMHVAPPPRHTPTPGPPGAPTSFLLGKAIEDVSRLNLRW